MHTPFLPLRPNTSECCACLAQARLRVQRNPGLVAYPLPYALPTNLAFPARQRFRSLKSPPALPPKRMSAVRFVFSEHPRTGPNKGRKLGTLPLLPENCGRFPYYWGNRGSVPIGNPNSSTAALTQTDSGPTADTALPPRDGSRLCSPRLRGRRWCGRRGESYHGRGPRGPSPASPA